MVFHSYYSVKNTFMFIVHLLSLNLSAQDEISLFNSDGDSTAFIDTEDDDLTIYLWGGKHLDLLNEQESIDVLN